MWLTFATFLGTPSSTPSSTEPATPRNIVIGSLAGAAGGARLAAIANDVPMQAWILVLIIFVWTRRISGLAYTGATTTPNPVCRCRSRTA